MTAGESFLKKKNGLKIFRKFRKNKNKKGDAIYGIVH
jgi:hypothetical protein